MSISKFLYIFSVIFILLCNLCYSEVLNIPPRPLGAMEGNAFKTYIESMSLTNRENAILDAVTSGNVPNFMRNLVPVTITTTINSQSYTVIYHVIPDYLAIGSDTDYFLIPLTPYPAQKIADILGCNLPTRKMVNDIWSRASVKLSPSPISPSPAMTTVPVFWDHNTTVRQQRSVYLGSNPLGHLVGGDKKDVVVTKQLATNTDRVAIYGWHYTSGTPIQNLYLGHGDTYADYSHGIRLINLNITVNGQPKTIPQVLLDTTINALLSDEGVVTTYRYNIPMPSTFPIQDSFGAGGRMLYTWTDKFTTPLITSFSPTSPGGDGYILVVKDPSGGMETTRTGNTTDTDYFVQSDIYCNYRPGLISDGFERVGIFIRDNGNGSFEHTTGGGGYCYIMAWDSGDGRLWCMKSINGTKTDLLSSPAYYPSSNWRRMRIEAQGSQLTFKLDDSTILTNSDTTFIQGQCGIGFHEFFTTNSNMLGTYADNFLADVVTPVAVKNWEIF